jgi:hypothetical protein
MDLSLLEMLVVLTGKANLMVPYFNFNITFHNNIFSFRKWSWNGKFLPSCERHQQCHL